LSKQLQIILPDEIQVPNALFRHLLSLLDCNIVNAKRNRKQLQIGNAIENSCVCRVKSNQVKKQIKGRVDNHEED